MNPATEIGQLVNRIMELAPAAGLYVGIKIESRDSRSKPDRAETPKSGSVEDESGGARSAIAQTPPEDSSHVQ